MLGSDSSSSRGQSPAPRDDSTAPVGRFGKYEITGTLGSGGMATVYRASMRGPGGALRQVALKLIHPHLSSDPEFVRLFLEEMRVAMAMSHRNIVQTFDAGTEGDGIVRALRHFLVMELCNGPSLREAMQRAGRASNVPLDVALFIGMEICSALGYAHTFEPELSGQPGPVIHRDISPSNVLLSRSGDVKLADFGVARVMTQVAQGSTSDAVKGKMSYMAPEQARGRAETRSDLFSVGALLYELLTGKTIRKRATLEAVLEGPRGLAPIRATRPDVPAELDDIVARCLRADPEGRPPSAERLKQMLGEVHFDLSRRPSDPHKQLAQLIDRLPPPPPRDPTAARLAAALIEEARAIETHAGVVHSGREAAALGAQLDEPTAVPLTQALTTGDLVEVTGFGATVVQRPSAPAPRERKRRGSLIAAAAAALLLLAGGASATLWLSAGGDATNTTGSAAAPATSAAPTGSAAAATPAAAGSAAAAASRSDADSSARAPGVTKTPAEALGKADARPRPGQRAATARAALARRAAAAAAARRKRLQRARRVKLRHAKARPRGFGHLDVNALPWAKVYVDGKLRGHTPLQGLRLSAGVHRVRLYNPDRKLERRLTVRVQAGQHATRVVRLK